MSINEAATVWKFWAGNLSLLWRSTSAYIYGLAAKANLTETLQSFNIRFVELIKFTLLCKNTIQYHL